MLPPFPSSMRAAATTPAEPAGAHVARFPADGSLPRSNAGSASAVTVFEACSAFTSRCGPHGRWPPKGAFCLECFSQCRCLHYPLQLLPVGTTDTGRDLHPLGKGAFSRRTAERQLWGMGRACAFDWPGRPPACVPGNQSGAAWRRSIHPQPGFLPWVNHCRSRPVPGPDEDHKIDDIIDDMLSGRKMTTIRTASGRCVLADLHA